MNLPRSSTGPTNSGPSREIDLAIKSGRTRVEPVGPSLRGSVFREKTGKRYFRLIPIEDVRALATRLEIEKRVERPRQQGLAPVVETGEATVDGGLVFYVAYEIGGVSLAEFMARADPRSCLGLVAKVFQALPVWWSLNGEANIPMPADIVFNEQWPFLLALPFLGFWPRLGTVIDEPDRIAYLAPEIIRGNRALVRDKNADIYACGAAAMQCLFSLDLGSPGPVLLRRSAAGTLFERARLDSRLPFWIDRVDAFKEAYQTVREALDPDPRVRAQVEPRLAGQRLESLARFLDPAAVVEDLQRRNRFQEAFDFIENVCLGENHHGLLRLGGQIARDRLGRPVEAIELLERAAACAPGVGERQAVLREQLALLLEYSMAMIGKDASRDPAEAGKRVDAMVERDFSALPAKERTDTVSAVATYFKDRGNFELAESLLYAHLFDGPTFLWWQFPLTLLYCEILIEHGRLDDAGPFLDGIRRALSAMAAYPPNDPRRLRDELIGQYGNKTMELQLRLKNARATPRGGR